MFNLMSYAKNDPFFHYFDNFEKNFWGSPDKSIMGFKTDIKEEEDRYILKADLPGFEKEDIKLEVKNDFLTIHAEHKEESKTEENNFIRRERSIGSYKRSFHVKGINTSEIDAAYTNGVLELDLPKVKTEEPETLKIEVK